MSFVKKYVVALVATLSLFAAGIGFAAWTANGTGTGAAEAIEAVDLTVAPGTTTAQLYPGGSGDLVIEVTNPNPYAVDITSLEFDTNGTITSSVAGCNASSVSLSSSSGSPLFTVPSGDTLTYTATGKVQMSTSANDDCQGATFTIPVKVTGTSA